MVTYTLISSNHTKGGFDKQSDGWAKLMEGPDSGFWSKYTRWSGKFESNFQRSDSEEYKTFIAEYKNEFGLTLTREQQKLLSSGGGAGDGGKGTNVDSTPVDDSSDDGSEETKEKKLKYNIKDLEHFSINKEKYIIERTVISDNSRGPWFAMPVGNKINIGINSSAENYKVVTDAFKKMNKVISKTFNKINLFGASNSS